MAGIMLSACASNGLTIEGRQSHARDIAAKGKLHRHDIIAAPFVLASWRRLTDPMAPIHVYIEGDGLAWIDRTTPSMNPTPKNPVALSLAAQDPAPNVIYIGRPCQYTTIGTKENKCPDFYWRGGRFAPEVIQSYMGALDQIATQSKGKFHLIGYSGGANIAGLLLGQRSDVETLRTVSGNIDNDAFVKLHDISPMPASLNMADNAAALSSIPQMHFLGQEDTIVPVAILQSYLHKAGKNTCIQFKELSATSHAKGWEGQWLSLLTIPVGCKNSSGQ